MTLGEFKEKHKDYLKIVPKNVLNYYFDDRHLTHKVLQKQVLKNSTVTQLLNLYVGNTRKLRKLLSEDKLAKEFIVDLRSLTKTMIVGLI